MSLVEKIEDESWPKEITDEDLSAGKIANLPNHPNRGAVFGATGLTAPQLKAYFDKNVELLKGRVNAIIKSGNPNTIAGKIEIGSINGWDDIKTLYDFIVAMEEGGLSDKFFVKFEDEEQRYVLNEFLQSLQKDKVQSKQGGTDKGKVYIINEDSDDALLGYSEDATPNSIVKRTESGDVLLPEGSSDERAAISRKDAAALLSEAVTKDVFEEEHNRTNTFVKSAKVEYDEANHVIRLTFTDGNGETDTSSVDLPLEMAFVGARLEEGNLVFTLQNGQEVSVPIGDVLGGLITSGTLAQSLSGNEEDKAPSVKAVNNGLGGKVDKITKTWQAYTTDGNGNTVHKALAAKPSAGGVVLYNEGGIVKTNAPVDDLDCVNKKTMDDGLSKKLDALTNGDHNTTWLYGNSWDGKYQLFKTSPHGTVGQILMYGDVTKTAKTKPKGTIGVNMPEQPYQATPKQYVDNKFRDLQQGVYNALGVQYITVEDTSTSDFSPIPEGAMPFAYFESLGDIVVYGHDGKVIANTAEVVGIYLLREGDNQTAIDMNSLPTFFEIPNGCNTIMLSLRIPEAESGLMDRFEIKGKKIIYQVKVGA